MQPRFICLCGLFAAFAGSGCAGSAVVVAQTAEGGVMSLDGEHEQAMADARQQMSEACGGAYTIVGERRMEAGVIRGQRVMEQRVTYACGEATAAPRPSSGSAAQPRALP